MAIEDQKLFRNGIEAVLKENPENRCCKYAIEYLNSDEGKALLIEGKICNTYFRLFCGMMVMLTYKYFPILQPKRT